MALIGSTGNAGAPRREVMGWLLAASALAMGPAARAGTGRKTAALDAAARRFISEGHAPGVSVAVMREGRVVFARGYGLANLETATPVAPGTVFRAGSITKMFTATAVMLLVQEGRIALDAPAAAYVPELADAKGVTVRMLLTHTSGLHTYTDEPFASQDRYPHTPKQMIDYIVGQKPLLDFEPGSAWRYSNSNFYVAGVIVERVSGLPLDDFLRRRVIAPAGLGDTGMDHERDVVAHRASGYLPVKGRPGVYENAEFISMDPPGGAGGLRSTASDLARFHQAMFAGRIVRPESLRAMTTPARLNDGTVAVRGDSPLSQSRPGYGFGLELGPFDGEPTVGHGGAVPGFVAYLVTFPRLDLTMAVMTNGDPTPNEPFKDVERAVLGFVA